MRRTNPTLDLAVMLVRGELGASDTQRILGLPLVTVFYVDPPPPPLPTARATGAAARLSSSQLAGGDLDGGGGGGGRSAADPAARCV